MGYHRAGFEVTGVDNRPQPNYPFEFVLADAMEYPLDGYDVIHASPPCQAYSVMTKADCRKNHPKLISDIRKRLIESGAMYVIENVTGARDRLRNPIMLCGTMFGLNIQRHRYFEIYPLFFALLPQCNHKRNPVYITGTPRPKHGPRKEPSAAVRRSAMGTPWMTVKNMDEAIPPAYTEFIGSKLLTILKKEAV